MGKPSSKTTWVGLLIAVLTLTTAYLGNDKYQQIQGETTVETKVETTVEASDINVAITSMPAGSIRSDQDIKSIVKGLIDAKMKEHEYGGKFH